MFKYFIYCVFIVSTCHADLLSQKENKGATLKPLSVCCDIPELGDPKFLAKCSNPKLPGPCNDVQCVFEESGFLTDRNTLNKEAYKAHLRKWEEDNKGWTVAVDKAIADCVDNEPRQHLDVPCKAYDVFTCTGIAMLKKCPEAAWKC
uniref:Odorant binding protein n=1 Tax=Athetis dissimilis TaxID=1737331 RepID=A0A4D6Q5V3_ATHDI|nr:odorant binding protein [Athetis dissimilis]